MFCFVVFISCQAEVVELYRWLIGLWYPGLVSFFFPLLSLNVACSMAGTEKVVYYIDRRDHTLLSYVIYFISRLLWLP